MEQFPPTVFLLELLPSDANNADPALISAVGKDVAALLREQGQNVQPVYTGQRGGDLLLQIMSTVWANKEVILSDLSSLVTILTPIVQIALHVKQAYNRRVGKEVAQQHPVSVTLEIKGMTLTIEGASASDATEVATKLAQQILVQSSPSVEPTSLLISPNIQARIPKRPTRKRR